MSRNSHLRRILISLLSMVLVFVAIPSISRADETVSKTGGSSSVISLLTIGSETIDSPTADMKGDGWSWNDIESTLILNGYNGSGIKIRYISGKTGSIKILGDNYIDDNGIGIDGDATDYFCGDGKLEILAGDCGICVSKSIAFNSCRIRINSKGIDDGVIHSGLWATSTSDNALSFENLAHVEVNWNDNNSNEVYGLRNIGDFSSPGNIAGGLYLTVTNKIPQYRVYSINLYAFHSSYSYSFDLTESTILFEVFSVTANESLITDVFGYKTTSCFAIPGETIGIEPTRGENYSYEWKAESTNTCEIMERDNGSHYFEMPANRVVINTEYTLLPVKNITLKGEDIVWDEFPGADHYSVTNTFNDYSCNRKIESTSVRLGDLFTDDAILSGNYRISVYAMDDKDNIISSTDSCSVYYGFSPVYAIFDLQGHGSAIASQAIFAGNKVKKPADPVCYGYIFDAWYTNSEFTKLYDFNAPIENNTVLCAKWFEAKENSWIKLSGGWIYVDEFKQRTTLLREINGNKYYFDPNNNNLMVTGWFMIDDYWYYFNSNGAMATGWSKIGNTWYCFDSDGHMLSDGWKQISGIWYYFNANGSMMNGWLKEGNTWYYLNDSGAMATGWLKINGIWYYFDTNGSMKTGWFKDGNTWYYFNAGGAMVTGWLKEGNTWYYMNDNGAMATGWKLISGVWYYFENNGSMVTGSKTLNGKNYEFDSNGHCTNP